jgi:hypothetical protein
VSASEKDTGIEGRTEEESGRVGMDIRTILVEVRNKMSEYNNYSDPPKMYNWLTPF